MHVYFNNLSVLIIILSCNLSEKLVSTYPMLFFGMVFGES